MRNLPALFVTAALALLNATAIAQALTGSGWYNGDFNGVNGLANEQNTIVTQAAVYDDFNVPAGQTWNVTGIFSDNLTNTVITGADWEIRQGVSEGNAGTLIANGTTSSPLATLTGRGGFGYLEYQVEVTGVNISLPPGTYWLNVTPIGDGTGRSFNSTTSGTNCVGTPCGNDQNAFFNSTYFGTNFTSTANEGQPYDYSMGVIIFLEIPEPATLALLTCGLGALLIALRRRRSLVRAALPALFVTAALALLNATAIAQAPPGSIWYNGDWNSLNGLANERNTGVSQAAVYDDFNVTAPLGWNVTAVFSDNLENTVVTAADWEIRTGLSEGNGGTLIASGTTNTPAVTPTGRGGFGFTEYMVEVTGLNIFLPMLPSGQHYWLNVTPVGNGSGRSFNTTTSGTNCVGTPCGNDQDAFFNSTFFGTYFTSTANEGQPTDFSNGVIGTMVPEPATVVLLTCGLGALLIALRRRSAAHCSRARRSLPR